jgi:hypothetical protein
MGSALEWQRREAGRAGVGSRIVIGGLLSERGSRPSSGWVLFASRTVVVATSFVIGATRAPALIDGIPAIDKRGQMTGERRGSLDQQPHLWGAASDHAFDG